MGSHLSSRIRRLRAARAAHAANGNNTRRSRARRDTCATVQYLRDHQRSRAELCLGCGQRVKWVRRAYYLPESPRVVERIKTVLQGREVDLDDNRLPTSLCETCYSRLHRGVVRLSFIKKLNDRLSPTAALRIADGTRTCNPEKCSLCIDASYTGDGRRFVKQPKLAHDSDTENGSPEHVQQQINVIDASKFAAAASVAGHSGRSTITFAKALLTTTSGKSSVSPGLKDIMTQRNKLFLPVLRVQPLAAAPGATVAFAADVTGCCQIIVKHGT